MKYPKLFNYLNKKKFEYHGCEHRSFGNPFIDGYVHMSQNFTDIGALLIELGEVKELDDELRQLQEFMIKEGDSEMVKDVTIISGFDHDPVIILTWNGKSIFIFYLDDVQMCPVLRFTGDDPNLEACDG